MVDKFKVVVSGLVKDSKGRLLVIRRSDDEESFPGMLAIPGGTIEVEETGELERDIVEKNLIREVFEETGVKVAVGEWAESTCVVKPGSAKLYLFFRCSPVGQQDELVTSAETPEVFWANPAELDPKQCAPTLQKAVVANK